MLDVDSYRQQTAFRINQAISDELSPLAQRHVAEIAIANVRTLCDEVERLRTQLADAEQRALTWQATAEHLSARRDEAWQLVGRLQWAAEITAKALKEHAPRAMWVREPRKLLASALKSAEEALTPKP